MLNAADTATARTLAFLLCVGLFASVALQYVVLTELALKGHADQIPVFEHLFNAWLPVIAGLAGAAVAHYFTKKQALTARKVGKKVAKKVTG